MSDTAAVIEKRYHQMLMRLTPEQRLLQTCRMFTTAKRLAESSIRAASARPLDDEMLRRELFLRLYGRDVRGPLREMVLAGHKPE
jgi:hypothetical protein